MSIEGFIMSHIRYCRCNHVVAITEYLNSNRLHYRYISKINKILKQNAPQTRLLVTQDAPHAQLMQQNALHAKIN